MTPRTREELAQALAQLDSVIGKLEASLVSLRARPDAQRVRSQITLAQRRLEAMVIARELIVRELDSAPQ